MKRSLSFAALFTASLFLPSQAADLLLRGGLVITMEPGEKGAAPMDILVRDGYILQLAEDLKAPQGAGVIDLRGHLVMPGFIDAHSHLWITQMRGLYQNTEATKFSPLTNALGAVYTPEDTHIGILWGALESANAGITTVVDFFDNVRSPEHADAALRALRESPIRAQLMYGAESKTTTGQIDLEHLRCLSSRRGEWSEGGRLSLGLAWRLPKDLNSPEAWKIKSEEYDLAKELGLPVSVHVSGNPGPMFDALISRKLIRPGLQVVHATGATPQQLATLEAEGGSLALTPMTEHRVAYGITRMADFSQVSRQGLGIDGTALAGMADMFATMRLAALTESGVAKNELAVSPRSLLEIATRRGAESVGLGETTGSLRPGKRADIIALDLHALNLAHWHADDGDPAALAVYSARPDNITTVVIDGRVVKRSGKLQTPTAGEVLNKGHASIKALRARLASLKDEQGKAHAAP